MGTCYNIVNTTKKEYFDPEDLGGSCKTPTSGVPGYVLGEMLTNCDVDPPSTHFRVLGRWAGDIVVMDGDQDFNDNPRPVDTQDPEGEYTDIGYMLMHTVHEHYLHEFVPEAAFRLAMWLQEWRRIVKNAEPELTEYSRGRNLLYNLPHLKPQLGVFLDTMLTHTNFTPNDSGTTLQAWKILQTMYTFSEYMVPEHLRDELFPQRSMV